MDSDYIARLRSDAANGNKVAEALLVGFWLKESDSSAIRQWLTDKAAKGQGLDASFLEAELACFHAWPAKRSWRDLLNECCDAGHAEARFVASIYREWARTSGNVAGGDEATDGLDARQASWAPPRWTTVANTDGVKVEISTPFAPSALLGFVMANLGKQIRPSAVVDPDSGRAIAHPVRINQSTQWYPELLGWLGKLLECRLATAAGYDVSNGEVLSLLHYRVGQRYKAHFDCIGEKLATSEQGLLQGGQRTMTVLLVMGDDDFKGGETNFPRLGTAARPAKGELLRFNNSDKEGRALPASLHEGKPIESGQKWLLSKWVRQRTTPYGRELDLRCADGISATPTDS